MTVTEVLPDDPGLRLARRERVMTELDAADVDILIAGREANARYVAGAPRLWTAGSRPFGVGCVLVRATGAIHLLSTWDEGIPDDIPHENLYGISFNSQNFLRVLQGIEGAATAQRVATDALTPGAARLLPAAFPAAEIVDGEELMRRARRVKTPDEVEAIGTSVHLAEESLAAAEAALRPGISERELTGVFMEAMSSASISVPATQDVAWITSPDHPWQRISRDRAVESGDLVALEAGVMSGGYVGELCRTHVVGGSTAATDALFGRWTELWDLLVAACRAGSPAADLLDAYDAAGVDPPPMPVAHGLGLGYDLPVVTHALPRRAADEHLEAGMVLALTAFVWEEGVGAVYGQDPVVVTEAGPELLSTNPFRQTRSH